MPTVLRVDGFRVVIYTRDHRPPHVHVLNTDGRAVITLGGNDVAPGFREVKGMRDAEAMQAMRLVREHHAVLLQHWERIHG